MFLSDRQVKHRSILLVSDIISNLEQLANISNRKTRLNQPTNFILPAIGKKGSGIHPDIFQSHPMFSLEGLANSCRVLSMPNNAPRQTPTARTRAQLEQVLLSLSNGDVPVLLKNMGHDYSHSTSYCVDDASTNVAARLKGKQD